MELIITYAGIAAVILGLVNLIFSIIIFKRVRYNEFRMMNRSLNEGQTEGVVICYNCNYRYSAGLTKCPTCGTVRKKRK